MNQQARPLDQHTETSLGDQQAVDPQPNSRTCPECQTNVSASDNEGEIVCDECGLVLGENRIDRGPEWRSFSSDEQNESRVGAPVTRQLHDKGLSSVIGYRDVDAGGNPLSTAQRRKMQRLRTWDERFRAKSDHERNLKQALGEISRMGAAVDVPDDVVETASVLYRRALEADLLPGRSIEGIATACLYAAARRANIPRSLDDFAEVSRVERRRIQRAYRYLASELRLEIAPTDPVQFLPRFVSALKLSTETEHLGRELLESAKRQNAHSGKSPVALAAGAVYAAAGLTNESITQETVANVTNVSPVTIRNRYQELLELYSK
ncbi:transcription initiation factor IIB [Haladaptatus salinisoli]|uniref:transcription initiation factor IIB n=1 Tax=Haladaptatus salinisoli TaxID=2884876 RepID=UPI001D0BE006|nr:TFIIB-type zinc ribbon-containing protein [Haladaptatus salinisoli]